MTKRSGSELEDFQQSKKLRITGITLTSVIDDCMKCVLAYLSAPADLHHLALTCKHFHQFIHVDNDLVWKELIVQVLNNREEYPFLRNYGLFEKKDISHYEHVYNVKKKSWRNVYKDMFAGLKKFAIQFKDQCYQVEHFGGDTDEPAEEESLKEALEKGINLMRSHCQLRVRMEPGEAKAELPVGSSKFYGKPDLPASIQWPMDVEKSEHLIFIAQINMKDISGRFHSVQGVLPTEGWLYFFMDWENDCRSGENTCCYYWNGSVSELTSREFPEDMFNDMKPDITEPIIFEEDLCYVANGTLQSELDDDYVIETIESLSSACCHLLGHAHTVQDGLTLKDAIFLMQFNGTPIADTSDSIFYYSIPVAELPCNSGNMKDIWSEFQC